MTEAQKKATTANLAKGAPYKFTSGKQAAEAGRNGRIKRMQIEKERKLFREALLARMGEDDINAIADAWIERAKTRLRDAVELRDTIDGKPKETHENTTELTADVAIDAEAIRAEIWKRLQEEI